MFSIRSFETKTISWWYSEADKIDFNPPYQRKGGLWTERDKSYLIDTILNGFDIPKIYMADFTFTSSPLNQSKKPYAVIDGKQRLEAIFGFFEGKVSLDIDFILLEDPSVKLARLGYKDLKSKYPKLASKFENFNLSVISVITDDESMINELFIRLNKSKPLTGAEVRNAMKGEVPIFIREIADHPFFKTNIRFSRKRGEDKNVAAKLLLIEFRGKFVDTKKVHLDRFVKEAVESNSSNFLSSRDRIINVLNMMHEVFLPKDPLFNSSGLIPVYYMLFKNYGKDKKLILRDFLIKFNEERKEIIRETKKLDKTSEYTADVNYVMFDNYSKSLNDQASLLGCYQILVSKFQKYNEGSLFDK